MKNKFVLLVAPVLIVWALLAYLSYGNYSSVKNTQWVEGGMTAEGAEKILEEMPSIYSEALYQASINYDINEEGRFNPKIEGYLSEVAWVRPLSPAPWVSLANWSADNGFFENGSAYLVAALLLLRNKPSSAWELHELTQTLGERNLSIEIASRHLSQNPREFSEVMSAISSLETIDEEYFSDVLLASMSNKDEAETANLLSKYVIDDFTEEAGFLSYLFEVISQNELDINKRSANYFKKFFLNNKDYYYLRRNEEYFSGTNEPFRLNNANINQKGRLCWSMPIKSSLFGSKVLDDGVEITFLADKNITFAHLSCGFFIPLDSEEDIIENRKVNIQFSLNGRDVTSSSGVYAEVYQPGLGRITQTKGSTGSWNKEFSLEFVAEDLMRPFYFRLRRDKTKSLDNKISGKVTLSDFSISFDK